MEETNDFRQPGDIGGPMDIGSGYRWNVPVVTYGFDKSFLDFFGTNGVAAVENAIQVLNDLPPASQIILTNYPLNSASVNYQAQAGNLFDLKSATLVLLLEQMGLTQPTRYVFALKQWEPIFITDETQPNWPDGTIPNYIVQRNFDPETLTQSFYVNGTLFSGIVLSVYYGGQVNDVIEIPVDPLDVNLSVADNGFSLSPYADSAFSPGAFFTGLTEDDVGGLRYLLSTNNVAYETLLPNVFGTGTNASSFVNGAWRPGVDKITFVPQPFDSASCQFLPVTNQFTDTYVTNGNMKQQQLQRVITQPDFIFCAGDVNYGVLGVPFVDRTGTTNWINNAALNGNPTNGGPGVIQPQIKIIFNKLGHRLNNLNDTSAQDSPIYWSTFDGSTNPPIIYPISQTGTNQFTIRMWFNMVYLTNQFTKNFDWSLTNSAGSVSLFQTSTNLMDWVTDFSVTNDGTVWTFVNSNPLSTYRFYRVIPQ
jgi:hypothetical protein